ncbi:MAG: Holliday junction resolvase RuvX [Bacillota bacterium]
MARVMALDIGRRRIGVALSDPSRTVASPLEVLRWGSGSREMPDKEGVIARLRSLIDEREVERVVVGLPRSMDGRIGPAGEYVMEWVELLRSELAVCVAVQDERLSTVAAERVLLGDNVRRKSRREVIDKMAAALILDSYLSRIRNETREDSKGDDDLAR